MKTEEDLDAWMYGDKFKQAIRDANAATAPAARTKVEPGPVVSGFNGQIRITRIDIPFLDLLDLVFKIAIAQAIIAVPIAVVLYFLLR
jgi:hypothetical protein